MGPVALMPQSETLQVRKSGNIAGAILLSMLLMQGVTSAALFLLNRWNLLDLSALSNTQYELVTMILYLLYLLVPSTAVMLILRPKITVFPLKKVNKAFLACLVFAGMAMAIFSSISTSVLMSVLSESFGMPIPELETAVEPSIESLLLNILSTALLPCLVEELVFRGYLFGTLRRHGDGIAILISALVFGLFHGNILQFPFAFLLGLVQAWLLVKTGSILPCILLHFANNLTSVLIDFAALFVEEGEAGAITTASFIVLSAIGTVFSVVLMLRDDQHRLKLFGPIGNGLSTLSVGERVKTLCLSPCMLVALILLAIGIVGSLWV